MDRRYRVLCVDDNQLALYMNMVILSDFGYEVIATSDVFSAVSIARAEELDLAILDYQMPEMNGAELAAFCKAANRNIKVILFSGCLNIPKAELASADMFVSKSHGVHALLESIETLLLIKRTTVEADV